MELRGRHRGLADRARQHRTGGRDPRRARREGQCSDAAPQRTHATELPGGAAPPTADALLGRIYQETKGKGNSPDQEAFTTIGDLLRGSYPPAELTTALYRAAAKIPGVVMVDDAVDAAGRSGIAVARLDERSGLREEWIFDRQTLAFLGERSVQVQGESGEQGLIKPGTVVFTSAITTRTVVDRIKEIPAG
ncbi:CU044_5270 family protein [Streptomyces avidinii]